jgi:cellulose synthase (UDP-forming)
MNVPLVTLALVAVLLLSTVILSRWVPRHPRWSAMVIGLNLFVTVRYLWWRGADTLNWEGGWGTAVSLATFAAELYGFLVVLHHYAIATRRTNRVSHPPDASFSPTVDVMVTTYNESADILTRTLVGCQAIEYPHMRLHLLDDGRRPEMARLCQQLGVHYISRDDNAGAKAGNLNHALSRTDAEFVVTLDADHVPVSSFLHETLGYFRDAEVVQVQTAHHFYNPDLFQGRLRSQEYVANEQDMFYHVVQPGRDVYNSSFYCGSGAVFRRTAIEEIGGFPTTTITEDLHTSVLLHSRGWRSVYVDRDLSAGLAPESFGAYLTQRRRWSRGTLQVMLVRGGLFLRGLSVMQRVNYFATLWYWLYGLPRVIYLIAPLAFLLFGLRPLILRDVTELLTYYLPHLVVSITAFQLVNRGMRRIFWSDIYESCIAVHIAVAALVFPFTARRVRFSVTPKGRDAEQGSAREIWTLGWPLWVLSALMVVGLTKGMVSVFVLGTGGDGTLVNVIWAAYNLIVLFFGLMLLRRPPQQRDALRLSRAHSCRLSWDNVQLEGVSTDLSETGVSLHLTRAQRLPEYLDVTLTSREGRRVTLKGRLVRCDAEKDGFTVAVAFVGRTRPQHRVLIELMYSAPDSWAGQHGRTMGAPEHLRRILQSVVAMFSAPRALRRLSPRFVADFPAVLFDAEGHDVAVSAVDISSHGLAVRLPRSEHLPVGARRRLTVSWNDYERTSFLVEVANERLAAMDRALIGLRFVDQTPEQKADVEKHLYGDTTEAEGLRRVS